MHRDPELAWIRHGARPGRRGLESRRRGRAGRRRVGSGCPWGSSPESSASRGHDRSSIEGQLPSALTTRRRHLLGPSGLGSRPASAGAALARAVVVGLERELAERALGAPAPESRHQDRAVELVLHPAPHRVAIAPHGREEITPLRRALPDAGLQAPLHGARLLESAVQVFAELHVAVLGATELGKHEQGRHGGRDLPRTSGPWRPATRSAIVWRSSYLIPVRPARERDAPTAGIPDASPQP